MSIDAAGNTSLPVIISGETLMFDNASTEIFGKGNVVVRHAENVIFADLVYINPDTGDVSGEGNVMAVFSNSRVYTEKIFYNTKTQEAYCKNADVISPPWIIRCEKMVKEGDRIQLITPVFTTCDDVSPHYRMEASEINMYGAKKIEAWNVAVYLGMIPVLYWPYFSQSLEGSKDPFEFQIKWNDANGWYTNIKYYYFARLFDKLTTDGQLGFNYYEKTGMQFNADLKYAFSADSAGSLAGSFKEEKVTRKKRWGIDFKHNQAFSENIRAGLIARSTSDPDLVKDNSATSSQYDVFKHEISGSFTGTFFGSHSIGLTVNDTEQLDTVTDPLNPVYYTYSRLLPGFTYNMTSTPLFPNFYYSHAMSLNRSYQYTTSTASGGVVYTDTGSFKPGLSANTPKLGFATLSANASLNSSWTKKQETSAYGWGEFISSLNTSETLSLDIVPGGHLKGLISHNYANALNRGATGGLLGITSNYMNGTLNGGIGTLTYDAALSYDLFKDMRSVRDRFSLLKLTGNFRHDVYLMSVNSNVSLYTGQIRNTALNISVIDNSPKGLWSVSAKADYVNNRMDAAGRPVSITAEDSLTFSTAFSFNFTPDFKASIYRNYDLMQKTLVSHSYALTWYIHCWQADVSWSKRADNVEEIFFSVAISAIPEFRVSKPSSAMPDQFKNLENLIPQ